MNNLYLIAHVVRGEPAFDIAVQMTVTVGANIGDDGTEEVWWIIPTSGHRAYPYWTKSLTDVFVYSYGELITPENCLPSFSADLPDHYASIPAPPGRGIADLSFLKPKLPAITRRV